MTTRPPGLAILVGIALAATPVAASAATVPVRIEFQAFAPADVEVLPAETVEWTNVSERRHTVTAFDGAFDSGDLFTDDRFSRPFDAVGTVAYHCTVHLSMTGTVDVRRVILDPLPPAAVPAGHPVELSGRTADGPAPVTIERDDGRGFHAVTTAAPAADGTWHGAVRATTTADYRAAIGADASTPQRLLVSDRKVLVHATGRGVVVTVTPRAPGAEVVLELRLRERFGWWPTKRAKLDYISRTEFRTTRHAPARVVLVDRDHWTPLAISPVLRAP